MRAVGFEYNSPNLPLRYFIRPGEWAASVLGLEIPAVLPAPRYTDEDFKQLLECKNKREMRVDRVRDLAGQSERGGDVGRTKRLSSISK